MARPLLWTVAFIARFFPSSQRAKFVFFLARFLAPCLALIQKNPVFWDRRANLYRLFLQAMTDAGLAFSIPIQVVGLESVRSLGHLNGSILLVSVHLAMNRLVHNALLGLNLPYSVIAGTSFRRRRGEILGDPQLESPYIIADDRHCLVLALKRLRAGSSVVSDIDYRLPSGKKGLSNHLFQLAIKAQRPIAFFASKLLPNGLTYIEFHVPQTPTPETHNLSHYQTTFRQFMTPFTQGWLEHYPFQTPKT
ncbi:MAG: hypothetical protein KDC71_06080 [Acidobacteria bacterium]|nr:hypothetical protein [Acidobacteriota bacterium]